MVSFEEMINILQGESDRGAVLIAASTLELALEELLKARLVDSPNRKDVIFEHNGPLGTFSSKIQLSYRIGLISKQQMLMFNTFREIRNIFAHSSSSLTLEAPQIRDKLNAAVEHNPRLRDLYLDALNQHVESGEFSKDFVDRALSSPRKVLEKVFVLEITSVHSSIQNITKIIEV
ncbi:hypothetical protein AB4562_18660 [Vibrio sp. 10N.222.54.A1]|nr:MULTISPECIES: hypothetical protein [unclassified Vibrio]PMK74317.1 hypothetical protein BCT92_23975 [Vibrio sp. 10N.261.52.E5]TKF76559.1 hypothetical protein FCV65_24660 [Vibrio sp. F13]